MSNNFSDEIFQEWKKNKTQVEIIDQLKKVSKNIDPFKTISPEWMTKLQEIGWNRIDDPYSFTNQLLKLLERENSL